MTVYVDNAAASGGPSCVLFADTAAELEAFIARLDLRWHHRPTSRLAWYTVTTRAADRAILFGAIPVDARDTRRLLARARRQRGEPA